nr:RNA-directed DNA polymerase, eukaryota [Tanacetum cinerariifolium]
AKPSIVFIYDCMKPRMLILVVLFLVMEVHVRVSSWFLEIIDAVDNLVSDDPIVWMDIKGVPLNAWPQETFIKIGKKWGETLDLEDNFVASFGRRHIYIKTKHDTSILESFKIIVKVIEPLNNIDNEEEFDDEHASGINEKGETIVMGDFNEVRSSEERRGSCFNPYSARRFDRFIHNSSLVDIKLEGYTFTWSHPSAIKMSKLNRFLVSDGIYNLFPSITAICLDQHISNHRPILPREVKLDFGLTPFRFYHSWFNLAALILKVSDAKFVSDFRPISLIGCVYKVITKVIANRLTDVISDIVSDTQSAFVSGRQILDDPFILSELLQWYILEAFGFGPVWCKWIQGSLNSAKTSILINGSPSNEFYLHYGLKQGDPLAPYLFILIMESLHLSIRCSVDNGLFKGIQLPGSVIISHLFYADDAMFIGEWVGVPYHVVQQASSSIGCSIMQNQFRYLGVTVGDRMTRIKAWENIIVKLRSRLSKWKVKILSVGGRLALLKSVLGASPIYSMSIFKVPRGMLNTMEAIRNKLNSQVSQSFRREPRGGIELQQLSDLVSLLDSATLNNYKDQWYCELSGDGEFRVKDLRNFIDDIYLLSHTEATRVFGDLGIIASSRITLRDARRFLTILFYMLLPELLIELISTNLEFFDDSYATKAKKQFNDSWEGLYNIYYSKYDNPTTESSSGTSSSRAGGGNQMSHLLNRLQEHTKKKARNGPSLSSEYEQYVNSDFVKLLDNIAFATFDLLGFWKAKESMFLVLSRMAMDIISVQATSIASESVFSTNRRVLSIRRTRLTPASLEMCMCLKDHLDAQEHKQHKSDLENPINFEEEIFDAEVQQNESIPLSEKKLQ